MPSRPDEVEHLGDDACHRVAGLADDLERERDVLADRLVGEQTEVLEDGADLPPQVRDLPGREPDEVLAQDVDLALGGPLLLEHKPEERGLAGAARADQEDELALFDVERDALECSALLARVQLGHVCKSDHVEGSAGLGVRTRVVRPIFNSTGPERGSRDVSDACRGRSECIL